MALRNPERWDAALLSALHPVRDLLEDDQVTEIEVNGPADIWIKGDLVMSRIPRKAAPPLGIRVEGKHRVPAGY